MQQISTQQVNLIAPDNIEMHLIDPVDGLLANEECAGVQAYPFIKGSEPENYSRCVSSTMNKAKNWLNDFFN
jgi:hypothetical protein